MSARDEVRLLAIDLGEGEQTREVCPFCGGGSSKEKSLNVTVRDGAILYNCHRASCPDGHGALGSNGVVRITRNRTRKPKGTRYEGELVPLTEEWHDYLGNKVGFDEWHLKESGAMLAVEENRVAYPIYGPMGVRRGWSLRSYEQFCEPKSRTHMDDPSAVHLSYYRSCGTSTVLIVEDIPSAVRASRYIDAVALLGTACPIEYAAEIREHYAHVVWALDEDATFKALSLSRQHTLLFESSRVLVLQEDLKDLEEEELCDLLSLL